MNIRRIELDGTAPTKLWAEMTLAEATLIAKVFGRATGRELNEVMAGGASAGSSVYTGLSQFLDTFFDGGVDGALRHIAEGEERTS